MQNDPSRIQELEKYIPYMSDQERDTYFLCVTDVLLVSFTPEQEANWERQLQERNDRIQEKFDGKISDRKSATKE